jgi:hypothetical protein
LREGELRPLQLSFALFLKILQIFEDFHQLVNLLLALA